MEWTQAGRPRLQTWKSNHRWLQRVSLVLRLVCCCQFVFLQFFCHVLCACITGRLSENADWTWKMSESGERLLMILTVAVLWRLTSKLRWESVWSLCRIFTLFNIRGESICLWQRSLSVLLKVKIYWCLISRCAFHFDLSKFHKAANFLSIKELISENCEIR